MRRLLLSLCLMLAATAPGAARAALFGDASIAYSAERTVTVNGKSYSGMVFHIPGHERHEQTIQGVAEVVVLDAAAKQGFLIVPMLKTYVTFAFPKVMAELDDPALRRDPSGARRLTACAPPSIGSTTSRPMAAAPRAMPGSARKGC